MKKRGIAAVILLPFVTFGIYMWYWFVKTKGELNNGGANIITAWIWVIPLGSLYWMWKYFEAAEKATDGKVNGVLSFILAIFVTPIIPMAICQDAYNNPGKSSSTSPSTPATPDVPQGPPVVSQ